MKTILVWLLFLLTSARLAAQNDLLPRGTVIYSIVSPEIFIPKNPAWMLLDGCDKTMSVRVYGADTAALLKFQSSLLHGDGVEMLPDARGLLYAG